MDARWRKIIRDGVMGRVVALLVVASVLPYGNAIAGTMTVATGGGAISADTAGGAWTLLSGPIYQETVKADLGVGTVILTAPAGFEFNTASPVTIKLSAGNLNSAKNINKTARGGTVATATVTATTITWTVIFQSGGNTMDEVTWLGIQVRPTAGAPLATGNIVPSGSSGIGNFAASAGTLTEVPGALANFLVEASGGGPIGTQSQGVAFPIQVTARDQFSNTQTSFFGTAAISSSCTLAAGGGNTGAFNAGLLNPWSVTISNTGTCTITATNVVTGISNSFTVIPVVNSFNAVEPGANAVTGKIFTKVAGQNFALDIVALDATNAIATSFTGAVAVEIVDSSGGAACSSLPLITAFTSQTFVIGDAGRHSLSSPNSVANVWRNARVRIKYPVASPTVISCSGDNFAVRPFSFSPVTATDLDWQTAGTTNSLNNLSATATPIHKAGQPFTLQATAVNAAAVTTTNYTGTPIAVLSPCAGTACTAMFGTLSMGTATAAAGVINSTTAAYSEVGAFALQLQDQTFAIVDVADGTTADCAGQYVCSAALNVGRFVPDHFDTTVVPGMPCPTGLACPTLIVANDQGFVYSGQTFTTNVIARNLAGATTINYDNAKGLAKAVTLTAWDAPGSTTTQNPPAATPGSVGNGVIAAASFSQGSTVAPGSPGTPSYSLPNPYPSATAPPGPTDVYLRATDTDNVTSLRGGASVEGGVKIVSGRMMLSSAHGSELLRLPIAATIQYWNGTSYVTSATDSTTTLNVTTVSSGNWTNLTPGNWQRLTPTSTWTTGSTSVLTPPASVGFSYGTGSFILVAPGAGNTGSVDMTTNAPGYLPSNTARATFGVYKAGNEFIYLRENY